MSFPQTVLFPHDFFINLFLHTYNDLSTNHPSSATFVQKNLGMTDQPAVHNQEVELQTIYKEQAVQVHCLCTFVDCRFYLPMQTRILLC